MKLDQQVLLGHFKRFEGDVPHFYLCGSGKVTIGIGCQVWDASYAGTLAMVHKRTDVKVVPGDIMKEFNAVKKLEPKRMPQYYNLRTELYLPLVNRIQLFNQRIKNFIILIEEEFADVNEFPENAQLVLLDMIFTLGVKGLRSEFPNFTSAFLAKDWKRAATECQRGGISLDRNKWAEKALLAL